MSEYTTIYCVPGDPLWTPGMDEFRRITEYFHPRTVTLIGEDGPERILENTRPSQLFRYNRISIDGAWAKLPACSCPVVRLLLDGVNWGFPAAARSAVPQALSGGYIPWDVHMTMGPRDVPDTWYEAVLRKTLFALTISGNSMPPDPPKYLEQILHIHEMIELDRFLSEITGGPWHVSISASY